CAPDKWRPAQEAAIANTRCAQYRLQISVLHGTSAHPRSSGKSFSQRPLGKLREQAACSIKKTAPICRRICRLRHNCSLFFCLALMTSSTPPQATDAFICPFLKTGRDGCSARFDRALFQLVISDEQEKILDLGFSGSRVLEKLLQAPGEVVSREELMSYAWEGRVVGQGSLNQQIYTLRQALFDD